MDTLTDHQRVTRCGKLTRTFRVAAWVLVVTAPQAAAIEIGTVQVGNVNNPPDSCFIDRGLVGGVNYAYNIGTTEVTNEQYASFLNAVAAVDPNGLYNPNMAVSPLGGIERWGESPNYQYTVRPNMANKPVNFVSFWDAARFANWMHNGAPTGIDGADSTDDGAYTVNAVVDPSIFEVSRNLGAEWFLPSDDEWYKAAFHANDGSTGNYFDYPTGGDERPATAQANAVGDISNPGHRAEMA